MRVLSRARKARIDIEPGRRNHHAHEKATPRNATALRNVAQRAGQGRPAVSGRYPEIPPHQAISQDDRDVLAPPVAVHFVPDPLS